MDEIYSPTSRFEIPLKNGYLDILLFYFKKEDNGEAILFHQANTGIWVVDAARRL